jgi:hypothetical protein
VASAELAQAVAGFASLLSKRPLPSMTHFRHSGQPGDTALSFDRRNGAHPSDDGIEILLGHLAKAPHWQLQYATIAADPLAKRAPEFKDK